MKKQAIAIFRVFFCLSSSEEYKHLLIKGRNPRLPFLEDINVTEKTNTFVDWLERHRNKLEKNWENYTRDIKIITFSEFCERFYLGTLEHVFPKSYRGVYK